MSLLDYYLKNKPLIEKIKVIISKKCSYDTVVWGSCVDRVWMAGYARNIASYSAE